MDYYFVLGFMLYWDITRTLPCNFSEKVTIMIISCKMHEKKYLFVTLSTITNKS